MISRDRLRSAILMAITLLGGWALGDEARIPGARPFLLGFFCVRTRHELNISEGRCIGVGRGRIACQSTDHHERIDQCAFGC